MTNANPNRKATDMLTANDITIQPLPAAIAELMPWALDAEAIANVANALGITRQVIIGYTKKELVYGSYYPASAITEKHIIEISVLACRTEQQAGETIWHELTHAMQYERAGIKPGDSVQAVLSINAEFTAQPYAVRPIEVEARANEHRVSEINPCRPVAKPKPRTRGCQGQGTSPYRTAQKRVSRLRRQLRNETDPIKRDALYRKLNAAIDAFVALGGNPWK